MRGYLATLISREEHEFIYNNIAKESGWLGGTRIVYRDGNKKLNDENAISSSFSPFTIDEKSAPEWYWANGPEAGLVFLPKPRDEYMTTAEYDELKRKGIYQGFLNNYNTGRSEEPNNSNNREAFLEFAMGGGTMWWNDLPYDTQQANVVHGYYVEFSEYDGGDEENPNDEESGDLYADQVKDVPQRLIANHKSSTPGIAPLKPSEAIKTPLIKRAFQINDEVIFEKGDAIEHYEAPVISPAKVNVQRGKAVNIDYTYTPKTYTISYDANGGTGTVASQPYTIETPTLNLRGGNGFEKKGYLNKRWRVKATGTSDFYAFEQEITGKTFAKNITLYADWEQYLADVTFNFFHRNAQNKLVPLKDIENDLSVVQPIPKMYNVSTAVDTILSDTSIEKKYKQYTLVETRFKVGTGSESTTKPSELTNVGLTITFIYQGTLDIDVPEIVSFKSTRASLAPAQDNPLTEKSELKVTDTQGEGSKWEIRAQLNSMMKKVSAHY